MLKEEIIQRNSYVDELKDKMNAVEIENRRLKVDLNGHFTMLGPLRTEVSALEEQTLSLANDCLQSNKLRMEALSCFIQDLRIIYSSPYNIILLFSNRLILFY